MSDYNTLLNNGNKKVTDLYNDIQEGSTKQNKLLTDVTNKNNIIQEKQKIQLQLMYDIENKEKLLLTRSRMLQISTDRNTYKQQLIYTSIFLATILILLIIIIYTFVSKRKV
jgi:hypothetical protein